MTPRVSIITPYRDAADFLGQAIDSVLAQTTPLSERALTCGAADSL